MRKNPSLAGLRALESVARNGSIAAAAHELCVTPAAISHRLTDLQSEASAPLLVRRASVIGPTEEGRRVINAIGDAFERLRIAHQILLHGSNSRALRVAAPTSLVLGWLIDNIDSFHQRHPGIRVEIEPLDDPLAMRDYQPDLVLIHDFAQTAPNWQKLCDIEFRVVYNPARLHRVLSSPLDLADQTLIRCDMRDGSARGAASWSGWLTANGVARDRSAPEIEVTQAYAALRMAMLGQGVALLSHHLTEMALQQGVLHELPGGRWTQGSALWASALVSQRDSGEQAKAFVDWLAARLQQAYSLSQIEAAPRNVKR